ncbi:hypothetical protein NC653_012514 [Populus alba x Populus x berolinensis]|uniref:S-locus receptor kinase C-terminal domain-containing protein n=1 Tax=Populus alba x Populus x berolinensis TaxID=444605 RepID=A0AAD6QSK0_9ROSI|nr:hypothetical protein NC653_012514 [Populus alba x Populus x berolinensis]
MYSVANVKKVNFSKKKKGAIIASTAVLGIAMLMLGMLFCIRRRNHRTHNNSEEGILKEGQEIAVKRLSKSSGQGLNEFKKEAWILWIKGTPLKLIDECLAFSSNASEVLRCIHVALLCVQKRPEDRPNISTVVQISYNENPLTQPKQPGFFMGTNPLEQDSSSNQMEVYSSNEVSLTIEEKVW